MIMRLDVFLKASRLCPRRTIAQKLCDAGLVSLNGTPAKSAHHVKLADEIIIRRRDKITTLRVVSVPQRNQVSKEEARGLYELLSEESVEI
jgi:ribosomal 50S subunit-recycling heat shock protein